MAPKTTLNETISSTVKGDHHMNCKDCKKIRCELNGEDFEITIQKCEAIDKLTKGQVPDGYVEIEPEFNEETVQNARSTIDGAREDLSDVYKIIKRINTAADETLTGNTADIIENMSNQIVIILNSMDLILKKEDKKWEDMSDDSEEEGPEDEEEEADEEDDELTGSVEIELSPGFEVEEDDDSKIVMGPMEVMNIGATYTTLWALSESLDDVLTGTEIEEVLSDDDIRILTDCGDKVKTIAEKLENLIERIADADELKYVISGGDE